jgi:predicted metalloprotease
MDYALSISVVANCSSQIHSATWIVRRELKFHCFAGVKIMSKEHKNKRDEKKKAVLSPKEKKAAKLARKEVPRNVLGN